MVLRALNTACVLAACSVSTVSILMHLKNYRKPMDQRLIVRILFMVPLFSIAAYLSLYSSSKWPAEIAVFVRELYEAFVIYTFYSLLTNLLGGEREIIFSTTGRPPTRFLVFKFDISDPPTYLRIKRLVLQFVWVRPIIALSLAVTTRRWLRIIITVLYNVSITLALNALTAFWISLRHDLAPYRVILKFLSVKLIVFFSYWQSLALQLVQGLGFITEDGFLLISNTLMCFETLLFAYVHWQAFPASDYNATVLFGFARLRIGNAFHDAIGCADLIHDFRSTFVTASYGHRDFDSVEAILDHPDTQTRQKRLAAGLRYRNGGRSKYWLPKPSIRELLARTVDSPGYGSTDSNPRDIESAVGTPESSETPASVVTNSSPEMTPEIGGGDLEDEASDNEDLLYHKARQIYGDYNYPVVTVRPSEEYVSFQDRWRRQQILESV